MKNLVILILIFSTLSVSAGEREKYSVTGKASSVNAFYHEIIECRLATQDAINKADDLCFRKGHRTYTRADFGRCKNRLFGGKKIKVKFYCY